MIPKKPGIPQDQHDGADTEVTVCEQPQVDHRVLVGHFPDDEHRQGDHRNGRTDDDEVGFEPVQVIALVEDDLQGTDADDQA